MDKGSNDEKPEVTFASTEKISRYDYLLDDFIEKVLGLEWAWVSDISSLRDFTSRTEYDEEEDQKKCAQFVWRIRKEYGVDVSDIEDGNLVRILERISESR
jgi:hypothetical protein